MPDVRFSKLPLYQGWGRPMRVESDVSLLALLEGEPPRDLNGTLYKVGPDRQFPPRHGDDAFIDGEGMVHSFRFHEGAVSYRSRWVRNDRFRAQEKAGRSLFGEYRNTFDKDPSAADVHGGTANTNAVLCRDKLLVLKEDDLPWALDPHTLETLGRFDYDGQVKALRLTAHPKIDPVADTLLSFGNQAKGDGTSDMVFYEFDHEGRVTDEIWFDAPFAGQVHDFAFTENYVVFGFYPLVTDLEAVKRTGLFYQWRPQHGTKIAVVKRHGTPADIRWFEGPPVSFVHTVNAFQEGSKIHLDVLLSRGNWISFHFPEEGAKPSMPDPQRLRRIEIDLSPDNHGFEVSSKFGTICELARVDDRWLGHSYNHVWTLVGHPPSGPVENSSLQGTMAGLAGDTAQVPEGYIDIFNGNADVGHVDLRTGEISRYSFGPCTNIHEPHFLPRRPDSPEGDGWLLVIVNRLAEGRSEMAVLDALNVTAGPVALYDVGVRVRSTFHGNWIPEETFRTHRYGYARVPGKTG
ncbi:carotenoid oxygenase family protein [Variovorax sp. Varisp62]|uniref:carotenoid oxygenase family protein n=1 Tax=Variovorax sp. Varisp62 TaxID=3243049 RepID=UPI0039B691EF